MKKYVFIVAVFLGVSNLLAQDQQLPTLTFEEAVKIGLEKNVNLNTQRNTLYGNQALKTGSLAAYLPSITAGAGTSYYVGPGTDPNNGNFITQHSYSTNGSLTANLILFQGFARINTFKRYDNQLMAQASAIERARQDAVYNVANQYLLVLLDQELLRIAEENKVAQQTLYDQIKGNVELGAKPQADQFNQEAQVKIFEVAEIRARVTLQNDKSLLAQLLQLDPSKDFQVAKPTWTTDTQLLTSTNMDQLYATALSSRPDLKQSIFQINANKYAMKAATAGYMPTINAQVQTGSQYSSLLVPAYGVFENQFPKLKNTQYFAGINIPIFDRLVTRTNRIQAKVLYENSILTKENLEKTVKIDVQRAFKNYQAALENYNASQAQFNAGDLALKVQKESYELGIASQLSLAQANQIYVQGAASKAQAEVTLMFQKVLLDYAMGTLNPDSFN
ncbi:MAG TPA: TolC family protein [Cyclobacteriaceae bacterium]|jgi:outer membrane protein|nr:TolC family protein [Cyclobacteriaceae bacterium]